MTRQASKLDATAFSRDGVVYLPDSTGSLNQASTRALLAHELTHTAQQRMFGDALPDEASPEGRELEEQAMATQRWFLGATGEVPALALMPSGPAARPVRAVGSPAGSPAGSPVGSPVGEQGVQRFTTEAAASGLAAAPAGPADIDAPAAPAGSAGITRWTSPWAAPVMAGEAAKGPDAAGEAAAEETHAGLAELRARVAELARRRPADLDDPVELDELAAKLYRRLRTRLRLELIVDRERAGLLTDFR